MGAVTGYCIAVVEMPVLGEIEFDLPGNWLKLVIA
jgi:hypothetical protein